MQSLCVIYANNVVLQIHLHYPFARRIEPTVKANVFGTHDFGKPG